MIDDILTNPEAQDSWTNREHLRRHIVEFFMADEVRSDAGNLTDPLKAAVDAIRDLRGEIRYAVEHGALTPESHRQFIEIYAPLFNMISAGPPCIRAREWRALFSAGVLHIAVSPPVVGLRGDPEKAEFVIQGHNESVSVDVVVNACVDRFLPLDSASPFIQSLLEVKVARPYYNADYHPGGLDIDRWGRLRGVNGQVIPNLCVIGNLTEGPHYFTNMLPAPGLPSRITVDAVNAVKAMHEYCASKNYINEAI